MDTRLPTVDSERGDHLHDSAGRKQTPEGVGIRTAESGALVGLDREYTVMGTTAHERSPLAAVRTKPLQVEQGITKT